MGAGGPETSKTLTKNTYKTIACKPWAHLADGLCPLFTALGIGAGTCFTLAGERALGKRANSRAI